MIDRKDCKHPAVAFGSGDYYIFCTDCDARWATVGTEAPEYKDGIGAQPQLSNRGVGCGLSGELRKK